jgi:5-hydroxyisourate hydrolase-like protein (transthyretin family)
MFYKNKKLWTSIFMVVLLTFGLVVGNALAVPPDGDGETPPDEVVGEDLGASLSVGYTAYLKAVGAGQSFYGTTPSGNQSGWGGVIVLKFDQTGQQAGSFCTDLTHHTYYNEKYTLSDEVTDCRVSYLVDNYPAKLSGLSNGEAVARQMAVWHFADGFNPTPGKSGSARALEIIQEVDDYVADGGCANWSPVVPVRFDIEPVDVDVANQGDTVTFKVTLKVKEQPASGIDVQLSTNLGSLSANTVTTGGDGTAEFTVTSADAGNVEVSGKALVTIPERAVFHGSINKERQKLILTEPTDGYIFADANLVFQAVSGSVTVNIFHDRNVNGVDNAGNEENLSGWKVYLKDTDGNVVDSANTNSSGIVNFTNVANGDYTVTYDLQTNWKDTNDANNRPADSSFSESVTVNDDSHYLDFGVVQPPVVKVCTFEEAYKGHNGIKDAGEAGQAGWTVELHRSDGSFVTGVNGVTNENGQVILTFVRQIDFTPGEYYVRMMKQDGWLPHDQDYADDGGVNSPNFTLASGTVYEKCFGIYKVGTAVDLVYFNAEPADDGNISMSWKTGTEIDNAGFNIYRSTTPDGPWMLVNDGLIPAQGTIEGGITYNFVDTPDVSGTYYYKLEDIDLHGLSIQHDMVSAELQSLLPIRSPIFRPSLPR